mmetsp:Transcript_14557/g.41582  ORF Transcript_14557/g.41582 Transcript_14557/m.41582 type:complete len:269 (-) Transcript_14557:30-836(-)
MDPMDSIQCRIQPPKVVPMCWQWCGITSSVAIVLFASAGISSAEALGTLKRISRRASAPFAISFSSLETNSSTGSVPRSLLTKVVVALQHSSGAAGCGPSRSTVATTPTSIEVFHAWCTRATSFTDSPTRTLLLKWTSSMETVTQFTPLKRSAAMHAQMSIHFSSGPANRNPSLFASEGRTSCIVVTSHAAAWRLGRSSCGGGAGGWSGTAFRGGGHRIDLLFLKIVAPRCVIGCTTLGTCSLRNDESFCRVVVLSRPDMRHGFPPLP